MQTALDRLGTPIGTLEAEQGDGSGDAWQEWRGQRLQNSGASWSEGQGDPAEDGRWGGASLNTLHRLPNVVAVKPDHAVRQWGAEFARCAMDRAGAGEDAGFRYLGTELHGYAVAHQSLARVVGVSFDDPDPEAHCDTTGLFVNVDAVTGAVLSFGGFGCA